MADVFFSVLVVALNPGAKLKKTVDSILGQEYDKVEILVKDGMSRDGSLEKLEEWLQSAPVGNGLRNAEDGTPADEGAKETEADAAAGEMPTKDGTWIQSGKRLRILHRPDKGIYDAMNQAVELAEGDYVLFLNCGDTFYDSHVLERTAKRIRERETGIMNPEKRPCIFYGDTLYGQTGAMVHSAPVITGFTCYRNIPCHQSCFYDRKLFDEKKYDERYRIRADYDHFLWCYYRKGAEMVYMDMPVSVYEGGGYSEDRRKRKPDREEHRRITAEYMGKGELFRYRLAMALTLAPLRSWMAGNRFFSGFYHRVKDRIYR